MILLITALLIVLTPAFGQKKKKETPPSATAAQAETHQGQKMGSTIKDVLASLQGQQTNIGVLLKVAGDYMMFETDGDTLVYPLSTVQVVKLPKTEAGEPRKIEIRFLSKD
jgi:hypothetical protein